MQGSSDETANSVEEGSSGPGSSSGHSDVSSNEAASSRASQSAGSPGSEMHSDDMVDSEALKEDDEDEEEDEEEEDDDDDEDKGDQSATDGGQQKESKEQPETRKRKAGEALCEGNSQGAGPSCSGGKDNSKVLPFSPETSAAMVTAASVSLEGRMRLLDACSASSSARPDETASPQQPSNNSSTQRVQGPQEPSCLSRTSDFLGEAMGNELFNCQRFITPQHHHHHHHHEG